MTIPTILGKRLSRSAGAFTFLGAVVASCLKDAVEQNQVKDTVFSTLRRGLGWGSALHLILIALKLIGVDDGGLLLPGRGLWEVYPAMVAVPFATTMSLLIHAIVCLAAFSSDPATTSNEST
jgi:branched-subunit amino acid permease